MRRIVTLISILAGVLILAVACTPTGGGGTVVEAKKGAFEFIPKDVKISANTATTITFKNPDAVIHDWAIPDKNIMIEAAPGKEASQSINLPAGTYKVVCTQPGHEAAGMVGQLIVG